MFCSKCGTNMGDALFCPNCGAPAAQKSAPVNNQSTNSEVPAYEDTSAVQQQPVRTGYEEAIPAPQPEVNGKKAKKAKKNKADGNPDGKKSKGPVKAIIAAVVAIAIIVSGVLFIPGLVRDAKLNKNNPFIAAAKDAGVSKNDPKVKFFAELHNTIFSTESFSVDVGGEIVYDEDVNIKVQLGKDLLTSSFVMTQSDSNEYEENDGYYDEYGYWVESDETYTVNWKEDYTYVLNDGKFAFYRDYSRTDSQRESSDKELALMDVTEVLKGKDDIADAAKEEIGEPYEYQKGLYDAVFSKDYDAVEKVLVSLVNNKVLNFDSLKEIYNSNTDILKELVKLLYISYTQGDEYKGEIPAFDELLKCLADFIISTDGIEVEAEKNGKETSYSIKVSLDELCSDGAEFIRNNETVSKLVGNSEFVDELADELEEEAEYADDYKIKANVSFNSGKLSEFVLKSDGESLIKLNFSDVNNTKIDASIYDDVVKHEDDDDIYVTEISDADDFIDEMF